MLPAVPGASKDDDVEGRSERRDLLGAHDECNRYAQVLARSHRDPQVSLWKPLGHGSRLGLSQANYALVERGATHELPHGKTLPPFSCRWMLIAFVSESTAHVLADMRVVPPPISPTSKQGSAEGDNVDALQEVTTARHNDGSCDRCAQLLCSSGVDPAHLQEASFDPDKVNRWAASFGRDKSTFQSIARECALRVTHKLSRLWPVHCQVAMRELDHSTKHLPTPNALRTAVCSDLLDRLCQHPFLFGRYRQLVTDLKDELMRAVFHRYDLRHSK